MDNIKYLGAILIIGGLIGYFSWTIYHLVKAIISLIKRKK